MTSAPQAYRKPGPRPTQCRSPVRLGYLSFTPGGGPREAGVVDTRCKRWSCEGCGRRLRQLHGQLIEAAFAEHLGQRREAFARFVTVTWPADQGARLESPTDCAGTTRQFRLWVEDVRRHYAPRLEYYTVKEPTRRGRLHVHALTFGPYLPKCRRPGCREPGGCIAEGRRPCVQALAYRRGLGYLDLRVVRGRRHAAAYIAKYLGKDHIGHRWPRHSRRVTYSRDFAPTTIGRLGAAWSARSLEAGIAAGHIVPRPPPAGTVTAWGILDTIIRRGPPVAYLGWPPGQGWTIDLERGTVRHLGGTQTANLGTGEIVEAPAIDLSELAWLRRHNRRTAEAAAAILDPADPLMSDPLVSRVVYHQARQIVATGPAS